MARAAVDPGVESPPMGKVTDQEETAPIRMQEFQRAIEQLVTEDYTPVDNMFCETQQRLLDEGDLAGYRGRAFLHCCR